MHNFLKNYTINSDGTIDVVGDVDLWNRLGNKIGDMTKLPVKFGKVSGFFDCRMNKLTTLENSPSNVGHVFVCSGNELFTLAGCPKYVGGAFWCNMNKLTTLENCPNYVGGDFNCLDNKLISLEGCPSYIEGDFHSDIITHHVFGNVRGHVYRVRNNKQRIVI
jgi:hypothetical protein